MRYDKQGSLKLVLKVVRFKLAVVMQVLSMSELFRADKSNDVLERGYVGLHTIIASGDGPGWLDYEGKTKPTLYLRGMDKSRDHDLILAFFDANKASTMDRWIEDLKIDLQMWAQDNPMWRDNPPDMKIRVEESPKGGELWMF